MRAQRSGDPNGKILHVSRPPGATRVVARRVPYPWRYTIDAKTGDLYIGDVGEFVRESIKYAPAARMQGSNFGWPCFDEGVLPSTQYPASMCPARSRRCTNTPAREATARSSEASSCTIRGSPTSTAPYVYGDYCLGELIVLRTKNGGLASKRSLRIYEPSLTSFGTDAGNRVYFTTAAGVFRHRSGRYEVERSRGRLR